MLTLSTGLFFLTTFIAVGIALLLVRKVQTGKAVAGPAQSQPETSTLFRNESISTISIWGTLLQRFDFIPLMKRQIQQADLKWSVGRVTSMMLLSGTIALVVLVKGDWLPGWMNAALAYCASLAPYLYIWRRRDR